MTGLLVCLLQILEAVRPAAAKKGLESPLQLWGHFISQCKRNLHVVLCMSPIGDAFRERLRANPSLVNCCTIDWFGSWPEDALEAVALKQLKEIDLDADTRKTLVGLCQAMHVQVRILALFNLIVWHWSFARYRCRLDAQMNILLMNWTGVVA